MHPPDILEGSYIQHIMDTVFVVVPGHGTGADDSFHVCLSQISKAVYAYPYTQHATLFLLTYVHVCGASLLVVSSSLVMIECWDIYHKYTAMYVYTHSLPILANLKDNRTYCENIINSLSHAFDKHEDSVHIGEMTDAFPWHDLE